MKCTIPEISWHNRDPVLSLDIQPAANENFYRLASAGTDTHVLIWHLSISESGAVSIEAVCDLTRHQKAVNVVRWSPSGQYLASGDDDANVIIWQQKPDELTVMLDGDTTDKEKWSLYKVLRGHKEDVYDLCWSPNSTKLISGSVDNTAIVWDLTKGLNDNIITDHKGFVQGVSWDPLGQYLATLCSDRTCRIFNETGTKVKARLYKGSLSVPEGHALSGQVIRYYHDDTFKSYFRRLSFSPDGSLLATPSGFIEPWENNKAIHATYIYNMNSISQPAVILPSQKQYTIVVRFCPILFELWPDGPRPVITLPYRMVFAVATQSSVVLYDTQQMAPYAVLSNIHYTRLTDLTWSNDGRLLAISSTDGYCSLVTFQPQELGKEYVKEESDEENIEQTETAELDTSLNIIAEKVEEKKEEKKKPSFLQQWATMGQKKDPKFVEKSTDLIKSTAKSTVTDDDVIMIDDVEPVKIETPKTDKPNVLTPRRKKQPVEISKSSPKAPTPAKPIAVRRKPRNEQSKIANFFGSPSSKKKAAESKSEPIVIISDDSVAQDAWDSKRETPSEIHENPMMIEDSQNMKLVLEISDTEMEENVLETDKLSTKEINKIIIGESLPEEKALCNEAEMETKVSEDAPVLPTIKAIADSANQKKRVPFVTLSSPKNKKFAKQ